MLEQFSPREEGPRPIEPSEEYFTLDERLAYMQGHKAALEYLARGSIFTMLNEEPITQYGAVAVALRYEIQRNEEVATRLVDRDTDRRDSLTGLPNRTALMPAYEAMLRRARRTDDTTNLANRNAAILFDLDHFKQTNDTYGHTTGGDIVLQNVAQILREGLRDGDTAVRYGGEEFVVLLPGVNGTTAMRVAERLRSTIEDKEMVSADGRPMRSTGSFGVVELDLARTLDENLALADVAAYAAKDRGRNQVVNVADLTLAERVARIPRQRKGD